MTYNPVLDWIFSSWSIGLGILFLYVLIVYLVRRFFFPNIGNLWSSAILYFLIPFLWIMALGEVIPRALGYGRPAAITRLVILDNKLFVTDYIRTSGSKATFGDYIYRMHVIDPKTGNKKVRFLLGGTGHIVGVKGDSLVLSYNNAVVFFSATTGKEQLEWTKETLPKIFQQLSSGINEMAVDRDRKEIKITSQDGNKWRLSIVDNSLIPDVRNSEDVYHPTNNIKLDKYGIFLDNKKYGLKLVGLCEKPDNEHQKYLCGHKDVTLNSQEIFLDGKIIAVSPKDSCFLVMHYETIAHLKFIFTCMSLDGRKKLWETRQSTLLPSVNNDEPLEVNSCVDHDDGILLISIKREIIALQLKDGAIIWREVP